MHNLCILVGVIDGGVDTIVYVTAVSISIAEGDCVCACSLGHDAWSEISVGYINDREILKVNGEVYKTFLWAKRKNRGVV